MRSCNRPQIWSPFDSRQNSLNYWCQTLHQKGLCQCKDTKCTDDPKSETSRCLSFRMLLSFNSTVRALIKMKDLQINQALLCIVYLLLRLVTWTTSVVIPWAFSSTHSSFSTRLSISHLRTECYLTFGRGLSSSLLCLRLFHFWWQSFSESRSSRIAHKTRNCSFGKIDLNLSHHQHQK